MLSLNLFHFCYVVTSGYFCLRGLTICFNFGVLELHVFAPKLKEMVTPRKQKYPEA
jgi:hypothetical protein